jgi:signal transduction histidine kinase
LKLRKSQGIGQESDESFELLIQIWIRFVLAFCSLLVFFVDPLDTGIPRELTHMLLISYCLYSAGFVFVYDMDAFREFASKRAVHWIDIAFIFGLIALSGGVDSIFFFFIFFPIILSSFSMGFKEGQKVTIAAVILFAFVSITCTPYDWSEDMAAGIIRSISLFVFGHMVAYWGEGRIILKRRLGLLQDISANWNPRFGVDHAIMISLIRLVDFYRGNRGILVIERSKLMPRFVMYSSDRRKIHSAIEPKEIAETTAKELLSFPRSLAMSYENFSNHRLKGFNKHVAFDVDSMEHTNRYLKDCETLSNLFDDESFISVPYRQQGVVSGRIYLVTESGDFNRSDVAFAKQVSDALTAVIENMQLIDNLVKEAEGQERQRISLDVHDTTIQPYIGLTLALDALSREFNSDKKLTARIDEIVNMANMTIHDLRSYKDTLREKSLMRGDFLISAVKNQGERLLRFYGIQVEVKGAVDPNLSGRLAEASFQIIKEGLSNILRHTTAKKAFVYLNCSDTHLSLEIGNEVQDEEDVLDLFKPKSIFERALSLNGHAKVVTNTDGYTVISVTIPLAKD